MRKLGKLTLKELEGELETVDQLEIIQLLGGENVVINTIRHGYGNESTLSSFTATAYDDEGNVMNEMTGYFLEPAYDEGSNGADTAIPYGTYNVISSTYNGNPGYFEIANVSGRSQIKIHAGNFHEDTTGCLLPGTNTAISGSDYEVYSSRAKLTELTNFLNNYGNDGIQINIE